MGAGGWEALGVAERLPGADVLSLTSASNERGMRNQVGCRRRRREGKVTATATGESVKRAEHEG